MAERRREEVLNTVLAISLGRRGIDASPETILKSGSIRPDVIAKYQGLRCAIEGKIGGSPRARVEAHADASDRIEQGIAHLAVAVVYPPELRTMSFDELQAAMPLAQLDFLVLTEAGYGTWHVGGVDEIFAELRRAHEVVVRDDILKNAVDTLNIGLADVAASLVGSAGTCDRLIGLLGVGGKPNGIEIV